MAIFGNNGTPGSTYYDVGGNRVWGVVYPLDLAAGKAALVSKLTAYGKATSTTKNIKGLIYLVDSNGLPFELIAVSAPTTTTTTVGWWDLNFSTPVLLNSLYDEKFPKSIGYGLAIVPAANSFRFYRVSEAGRGFLADNSNSYASPQDYDATYTGGFSYYIYATYEEVDVPIETGYNLRYISPVTTMTSGDLSVIDIYSDNSTAYITQDENNITFSGVCNIFDAADYSKMELYYGRSDSFIDNASAYGNFEVTIHDFACSTGTLSAHLFRLQTSYNHYIDFYNSWVPGMLHYAESESTSADYSRPPTPFRLRISYPGDGYCYTYTASGTSGDAWILLGTTSWNYSTPDYVQFDLAGFSPSPSDEDYVSLTFSDLKITRTYDHTIYTTVSGFAEFGMPVNYDGTSSGTGYVFLTSSGHSNTTGLRLYYNDTTWSGISEWAYGEY